jgi:hypothetical protein
MVNIDIWGIYFIMKSMEKNIDPKLYSKNKLRYIFNRILRRIKDKPKGYFVLIKLRGACGYCVFDKSIQIDYRKLLVPTIIHEVLHDMYPSKSEIWILRVESKLVNMLSTDDIYKLICLFFSRVILKNKKKGAFKKKKSIKKRLPRNR